VSKRAHEGYFMQDHRHGDPVPDSVVMRAGLPPGAGRGLFESATITCPYCQTVVVLNPGRTRERHYDRKTDHYVCDGCASLLAVGVPLKTFKQQMDEVVEAIEKKRPYSGLVLP